MKNIKELFNNVRTKVKESKIMTSIKNVTSKATDNKIVSSIKEKFTKCKNSIKNFSTDNKGIMTGMTGDVSGRFSTKIKKFFKNIFKGIQTKANDGSTFAKIAAILIKIISIVALVGFTALVIYLIKDVFLSCLMFVAMCAATVISIEIILSILSIATGCRI